MDVDWRAGPIHGFVFSEELRWTVRAEAPDMTENFKINSRYGKMTDQSI
jgi:hypothetical protein